MSTAADVALLKSWDFEEWKRTQGHGWQLPYRMDYLEAEGLRLRWTDATHQPGWQSSRRGRWVSRAERTAFPFAQTFLMARAIASSPIVLAMFESEGNALAALRRGSPRAPASKMAVVTCWLAHVLQSSGSARRAGYRWAYLAVDRLYYFSENQAPVLSEHLGVGPERLLYVPFGIDHEAFVPVGEPDGDYVLVVGRDRGRDWTTTFEALRHLGLPVKVCCRPADIRGLSVPPEIEVLGYVGRDVYRSLLGHARVVVIATRPVLYPSGQSVLLEAMAMGRTVVVTETPALTSYIRDGASALAVPPGDPAALREQILVAVADDDLRGRLGAGGRADVEDRFNARAMWTTIGRDLLGLAGR